MTMRALPAGAQGLGRPKKQVRRPIGIFTKKPGQKVAITFVKVKGHSGVEYNEMADQLAKKALAE